MGNRGIFVDNRAPYFELDGRANEAANQRTKGQCSGNAINSQEICLIYLKFCNSHVHISEETALEICRTDDTKNDEGIFESQL